MRTTGRGQLGEDNWARTTGRGQLGEDNWDAGTKWFYMVESDMERERLCFSLYTFLLLKQKANTQSQPNTITHPHLLIRLFINTKMINE